LDKYLAQDGQEDKVEQQEQNYDPDEEDLVCEFKDVVDADNVQLNKKSATKPLQKKQANSSKK